MNVKRERDNPKMELTEQYAIVKVRKDLLRRMFGNRRGDRILLHPVEAVYLVARGLVKFDLESVVEWAMERVENFPVVYLVYRDLRDRGQRVRMLGEYLVSKKAYMPVSEREAISMVELAKRSRLFDKFVLAVVDEESEITYFRVRNVDPIGEQKEEELGDFEGLLLGDRVITEYTDAHNRYFYGSVREKDGLAYLSLLEAAYLAERGVLKVRSGERILEPEEVMEIARGVEEDFDSSFTVYRDLKRRGFVVKTGFKFGSDFRIYTRVDDVSNLPHSDYLVAIVKGEMRACEVVRAVRLAHSVRKKMLFAYFVEKDKREVEYLQIEWVRV